MPILVERGLGLAPLSQVRDADSLATALAVLHLDTSPLFNYHKNL